MKIEKEMRNISTVLLFKILHRKFLKYGWKCFSRLFRTLETIFVEFSKNFQTFPNYYENIMIFQLSGFSINPEMVFIFIFISLFILEIFMFAYDCSFACWPLFKKVVENKFSKSHNLMG